MTDDKKRLKEETRLLHAGQDSDPATGARAVPIYQTTSFCFENAQHAADLFALKELGNIYTRLMNPTTDVFEKRMASLEGGVGALALSSGMSAIAIAILNLASSGEEIVSADNLYGGTYTLFRYTLERMGIKVRFVPSGDIDSFRKAINPKTKAVYAETIGNPKLDVADLEALSKIAHDAGVPLIVDNTVAPYVLHPFEYGADIAVFSTTKFIGGHGTSIGGVIVDSGNFEWDEKKYPTIAGPDKSYHGLDFAQDLGDLSKAAYIVKARLSLLRDLGSAMSPFNAFLFLQGLETLHLRMPRHCQNALKVAEFLERHPGVSWVNYPGLSSSPEKEKADRYLPKGAGAIIGFGIKGAVEEGRKFIDSLELVSHLANIGDAKTLAIHPASTTHQQLTESEQLAAGVTPDYIRLSVGLEDAGDIIDDIDQALKGI